MNDERAAQPPHAALRLVPGLDRGAMPQRCEALAGGTVNQVWRVETSAGAFALRIDGPSWRRPGVDRRRELLLHGAAAAGGLAPAIVAAAEDGSVLVTRHIAGETWTPAHYAHRSSVVALCRRLAQLHALPLPAAILQPFDPVAIAGQYLAAGRADSSASQAHAESRLREVELSARVVAAGSTGAVIVHGDPTHANLIDDGKLWLVDWEYAQLADPLYDLAAVMAYYPAALPYRDAMAEAAGLAATAQNARLAAAIRVHEALGWLWHRARAGRQSGDTGARSRVPAN